MSSDSDLIVVHTHCNLEHKSSNIAFCLALHLAITKPASHPHYNNPERLKHACILTSPAPLHAGPLLEHHDARPCQPLPPRVPREVEGDRRCRDAGAGQSLLHAAAKRRPLSGAIIRHMLPTNKSVPQLQFEMIFCSLSSVN